jgi:hypothetical protein
MSDFETFLKQFSRKNLLLGSAETLGAMLGKGGGT